MQREGRRAAKLSATFPPAMDPPSTNSGRIQTIRTANGPYGAALTVPVTPNRDMRADITPSEPRSHSRTVSAAAVQANALKEDSEKR